MSRQELPRQGQMEVQWHVKGAVLPAWLAAEKNQKLWEDRHRAAHGDPQKFTTFPARARWG